MNFSIFIIFVFLVIASSVFASNNNKHNCISYKGICQSDWMSNLPSSIQQNRPIKDLMLLSTHDTGAQLPLNFDATPPCQSTTFFNIAMEFAKNNITAPLIIPIINNLTITQPSNVFQQLEQGIRGFDLRITWSNITNELYLSHSFVAQPLKDTLQDFQKFLTLHPGEMLIIQAEYDYEHSTMTAPKVNEIMKMFQMYLGQWLNPQCHDLSDEMTLNSVVSGGKRVFLGFSEDFDQQSNPNICGTSLINTYWPNGQNATQSIGRIKKYVAETNFSATPKTFQLVFFTVTDDAQSILADVLQDIFKTHHFIGLKDWSANIRPLAWEVLENFVVNEKRRGLSMVSVDWPTDEYVQKVINWNLQMN